MMKLQLNQKGFTLIEVIVVVVVIGVIGTIAIRGTFEWLPNMRLKSVARDIHSNMHKARLEAIKTNREVAIVFSPTRDSYSLCSSWGADSDWSTLADNDIILSHSLTTYKSGIEFGDGNTPGIHSVKDASAIPADYVEYTNNVLTFDIKGISSEEGYVYVHNENKTVYGVGTQVSGNIILKRWRGGNWK